MKLSAPIYRLKRAARLMARAENIPLHLALDRVAIAEGFGNWSLLAARFAALAPAGRLFARLTPGDLLLLGARPGHGKTLLSLELAVEAMKAGHRSVFFTLEDTERQVLERLRAIGAEPARFATSFTLDSSDTISGGFSRFW
jgi:DNA replication protein DnaC